MRNMPLRYRFDSLNVHDCVSTLVGMCMTMPVLYRFDSNKFISNIAPVYRKYTTL
jgi:hypothetical protein